MSNKQEIRLGILLVLALFGCSNGESGEASKTMASVLEASATSDWRQPDPANTLYMQLDHGTIIFELAPQFAPNTVANILSLVGERYFDGLSINRSQENYVVQWGDPAAGTEERRDYDVAASLEAEFYRNANGLDIVLLDSRDAYADTVEAKEKVLFRKKQDVPEGLYL